MSVDPAYSPQFAPASVVAAARATPAHELGDGAAADGAADGLRTSAPVGWTSVLLAVCESGDAGGAPFETAATPDQALVLSLNGPSELECFSNGRWYRAVRPAGSVGLTPGGRTDRLRRWVRDGSPIRTAHLYIPQDFFDDAREHYRRAGSSVCAEPLNALAFRDPAVMQSVLSLVRAMDAGAPDLYAESVAQFLARHLLLVHSPWADGFSDRGQPELLTDRRLARVVEYMTAHVREPLALARLAAEAGVSKFHFARLFRAAAGETPHRFLVRLRMDGARQMLRDTELTVAEVAAASGYASTAQFGAAFLRHTGRTPLAFRAAVRRRHPGTA